jgi:hypothetical protein
MKTKKLRRMEMSKIRKNTGIFLAKFVLPFMNRLTLRASGWERRVDQIWASRLRNYLITTMILWKDPNTGEWMNEESAITKCKERVV